MRFDNSTIRRQDRTLEQERAFEILREGEYGVLSMRSEDGNGAYGIPLVTCGTAAIPSISIAPLLDTSYCVLMPAHKCPSA